MRASGDGFGTVMYGWLGPFACNGIKDVEMPIVETTDSPTIQDDLFVDEGRSVGSAGRRAIADGFWTCPLHCVRVEG